MEFLEYLNGNKNIADWQISQAKEALRLYLDHFKDANALKELHKSWD